MPLSRDDFHLEQARPRRRLSTRWRRRRRRRRNTWRRRASIRRRRWPPWLPCRPTRRRRTGPALIWRRYPWLPATVAAPCSCSDSTAHTTLKRTAPFPGPLLTTNSPSNKRQTRASKIPIHKTLASTLGIFRVLRDWSTERLQFGVTLSHRNSKDASFYSHQISEIVPISSRSHS